MAHIQPMEPPAAAAAAAAPAAGMPSKQPQQEGSPSIFNRIKSVFASPRLNPAGSPASAATPGTSNVTGEQLLTPRAMEETGSRC